MMNILLALATAVSLFQFRQASAAEFGVLPGTSSIYVPAAPPPAAVQLLSEYEEYYSALTFISNKAFAIAQDSPEFYEYQAYGMYLRGRTEAIADRIRRTDGVFRELCAMRPGARKSKFKELLVSLPDTPCWGAPERTTIPTPEWVGISRRISVELTELLSSPSAGNSIRLTHPIKPGYCKINYVKNGVPFLVQEDGFLKQGEIILTFDDGPDPLTSELYADMKTAHAPSLFFVLGSKLGKTGRATIAKSTEAGHYIGVHAYHHATESGKPFTAMSTEAILQAVGGVNDTIAAATGRKSAFFRPPYGIIPPEALLAIDSKIGLTPVGWTIDTLDWSTADQETLYKNTIAMIAKRGKGIVLMHDIYARSRATAKRLVQWLADNGYTVVSPDRLTAAYRAQ